MNDAQCSRESGVRRAIAGEGLTEELRQHVSQCTSCREVVEVTQFMKGAARVMEREVLPDAGAMWSRIQLAESRRLAERAQRPARFAWRFAKCWFACVTGLILYREWPVIGNFILSMPDHVWIAIAGGAAIFIKGRGLLKRSGARTLGSAA